jgi:glutaredoxin-like protein
MFSKIGCPYCANAKKLLKDKGLDYEEIILGKEVTTRSIKAVTGRTSTPQVFIDGKHIGGSEELAAHFG